MIHACAGVEVVPEGPQEGDHMASGRVEMAVREVQRPCRTLQISSEQQTCVRIVDNSPLLSRLPRFVAQVINKMRNGKHGKRVNCDEQDEDGGNPLLSLERMFGSAKFDKMVSVHVQPV